MGFHAFCCCCWALRYCGGNTDYYLSLGAHGFILLRDWCPCLFDFGATEDSDGDRPSVIDIALALICVAVGAYFAFESEVIVNRIVLLDELTFWNIVFGTIVFLLTLELTRRTTGVGLTAFGAHIRCL